MLKSKPVKNLYSFILPNHDYTYMKNGFVMCKIGQTEGNVDKRIKQQEGSSAPQNHEKIGEWYGVHLSDYYFREILKTKGCIKHINSPGKEFLFVPGDTKDDAFKFLDNVISELEGQKIRKKVDLRNIQKKKLKEAIQLLSKFPTNKELIAHLCPRFGKTIWALSLFNEMTKKYGNRVMLLPCYWLSAHSSFINELDLYDDFKDIILIDPKEQDENIEESAKEALESGHRIIVPISLHGNLNGFESKYDWISNLDLNDVFVFADEGDFGTHTPAQKNKLDFLFSNFSGSEKSFIRVYASGTNIQRLAKCGKKSIGIIHCTYSELEKEEEEIIRRRFYQSYICDELIKEIEILDAKILPSWMKTWDKPYANKAFIVRLLQCLVGQDTLRTELNLSNFCEEPVDCFMLFTGAKITQMNQIGEIAKDALPDWHVVVLNSSETSNKKAEVDTKYEIVKAKADGKKGVLIISNMMGSRSYSISEVQACVIAYDRGSVDTTSQKVSRCLTPGKTYRGKEKEFGHIVDLSFDPNRSENIEELLILEASQVKESIKSVGDFTEAVRYVLQSIDLFKFKYGCVQKVLESELFESLGTNEIFLKVADMSADIDFLEDNNLLETLRGINSDGKGSASKNKKVILGKGVINSIREGETTRELNKSEPETKKLKKELNEKIRAINRSATSVYDLANGGHSYRECLKIISKNKKYSPEFEELFGISAVSTIKLLDGGVLNEAILDVIVQNSQNGKNQSQFATDLSKGILGEPDSEELWEEIISRIPDKVFLRKDFKALCVACGHGTEAKIISDRMRSLGISERKIKNSIYLLDKYFVFTHPAERAGYVNVIKTDFLEWETDMKFDVVIGNPPYQDGSISSDQNKIYNQISKKAISLLKKDGIICFITPTSVLKKTKRFSLIGEPGLKYVDFTTDDHFDVGVNTCAWLIDKTYKGEKVKVIGGESEVSEQSSLIRICDYSKIDADFIKIYEGLKIVTDKPEKRMFKHNNVGASCSKTKTDVYQYPVYKIKDGIKTLVQYNKPVPKFYKENKLMFCWTKSLNLKNVIVDIDDYDTCYFSTTFKSEQEKNNILSFIFSEYFIEHSNKWKILDNCGFNAAIRYLPPFDKNKSWTNEEVKQFIEGFMK